MTQRLPGLKSCGAAPIVLRSRRFGPRWCHSGFPKFPNQRTGAPSPLPLGPTCLPGFFGITADLGKDSLVKKPEITESRSAPLFQMESPPGFSTTRDSALRNPPFARGRLPLVSQNGTRGSNPTFLTLAVKSTVSPPNNRADPTMPGPAVF